MKRGDYRGRGGLRAVRGVRRGYRGEKRVRESGMGCRKVKKGILGLNGKGEEGLG